MQLLILGGTAWLGGHIAATALERGHQVTCLARGTSGAVPDGVAFIHADRSRPDAYDDAADDDWDGIVDVSSQPGQVRNATSAFRDRARNFIYISSCNVYAEHATPGQNEDAALLPALVTEVSESWETYGQAKVACEQHVLRAFGAGCSLIVRAGLIGGPGDLSHRTGYWPLRFARPSNNEARVLVPDPFGLATQIIDVRDLARWIVESACFSRSGTFNAMGETLPLGEYLESARRVAGHSGPVVARSSEWLLAQGVNPWMGERSLPLWIPNPEYAGFSARDCSAARAAGLTVRPVVETLADTLAWELASDRPAPRQAGLTDKDERALLAID